ncbi:hypothetical protein PILCRDRAFT_822045 [Piloderma croceum F 1598]|uniref:Zn(2)-C6 fungal-type domain-containing protein n=1 Tax=Piloderma croceum (strain F 1598) TaxID=765440 RepID=A0A0C3FLZ9_PILCF|nr:hypothetical protein PILCRDRAFT_822045 [Piloderma croceum F 1598]
MSNRTYNDLPVDCSPFAFAMPSPPTPGLQGSTSTNSSPFTTADSLPSSRRVSVAYPTPSPRSEDSDDFEMQDSRVRSRVKAESQRGSSAGIRSSGACVHCKSLKVRCEFSPGESICQRCLAGNHDCVARSRKKRKAAPTHEDLEEKSNRQDRQIESLLNQFDTLRTDQRIKEWMDRAQSDGMRAEGRFSKAQDPRSRVDTSAALAVNSYFSTTAPYGRGSHSFALPDIVKHCGLYPEEIFNLFSIFFDRVNPFFSILDPDLHTPERLIWTSPFLFTTICAVASRYYPKRNIYYLAMEFAKDAAGKALTESSKSVDIVQAFLLLAVYPVPKRKWSDDRSWLLMGVAFRMAIELGLNQPFPPGCDERESLNRTRTWLICFCVDGSYATQFGKMAMIPLNDHLARNSRHWYQSSALTSPFDIHLCAIVDIHLVFADFRKAVSQGNLRKNVGEGFDVVSVAILYDEKLSECLKYWIRKFAADPSSQQPICRYRGNTTQLTTAYLRLVVLSSGFQYAVKQGISRDSPIVQQSISVARSVIHQMTERLYPTGNLRYALEATFLYVAFASAFLINLLRPKFIPLLDESQQKKIIASVRTLIQVLGSKSVALDGRHTPALYSRFLSSQLARHNVLTDSDSDADSAIRTEDIIPQYRQDRRHTPPHLFAWPDTGNIQNHPVEHATHSQSGVVFQQYGEADMDFSVHHFMDTVKTQDGVSAKNFIGLRPEEIFTDWESVHVNVVEKTNPDRTDVAWSTLPTEADAWIHTLY